MANLNRNSFNLCNKMWWSSLKKSKFPKRIVLRNVFEIFSTFCFSISFLAKVISVLWAYLLLTEESLLKFVLVNIFQSDKPLQILMHCHNLQIIGDMSQKLYGQTCRQNHYIKANSKAKVIKFKSSWLYPLS